jgi:hypothetical protein
MSVRGVSNVISAVFVIAIILTAAYMAIGSLIEHSKVVIKAERQILNRQVDRTYITYGDVNVEGNVIHIAYTGGIGEYAIRLYCYDNDTHTKTCVVPTYNDKKSISYWDPTYKTDLEFNVAKCDNGLADDLQHGGLSCYIIGEKSDAKFTT